MIAEMEKPETTTNRPTADLIVCHANLMVNDVPSDEYHRPVIGVASKSMLDLVDRSPAHYYAAVTGAAEREDTAALRFGRIFDEYTTEMPKALLKYVVEPEFGDGRTKAVKEAKAEFYAAHDGAEFVSAKEWKQITGMGDAIHKNPIASALILGCKPQVSLFWTDPETGLRCKARLDGLLTGRNIIADLKTTVDASPHAFASSCLKYRYHVQAALYSDALEIVTGRPTRAFIFVAVEKEPPYAVATYKMGDSELDLGRDEYRRNLRTLAECVLNDSWPAYGTATNTISFPTYAFNRRTA